MLNKLFGRIYKNKGGPMNEQERLLYYLERLKLLSLEKLESREIDAVTALKESLHIIEGEMRGY